MNTDTTKLLTIEIQKDSFIKSYISLMNNLAQDGGIDLIPPMVETLRGIIAEDEMIITEIFQDGLTPCVIGQEFLLVEQASELGCKVWIKIKDGHRFVAGIDNSEISW